MWRPLAFGIFVCASAGPLGYFGKLVSSTSCNSFRFSGVMSTSLVEECKQKLDKVANVDIDPAGSGKFKYVLIKVHLDDPALGDQEVFKYIVRGYVDCAYHSDVYERLEGHLRNLGKGFDSECTGGGRIVHEPNKIKVFGYSQGYGKADHAITVDILKKHFPVGYDITWSDEGY